MVTPNLDILRRATRDREFRSLYDATTLRLADGMPLVWASRLQRTPLPERAAGSDLIWKLAEHAADRGVSIFLLGGNPGTADKSVAELTSRFPRLRVAGIECPPPGFETDPDALSGVLRRVAAAAVPVEVVAADRRER